MTVATTLSVLGDRLPTMVTQVYRGDVQMVRTERWSRVDGGRVRGQISTVAHGRTALGAYCGAGGAAARRVGYMVHGNAPVYAILREAR